MEHDRVEECVDAVNAMVEDRLSGFTDTEICESLIFAAAQRSCLAVGAPDHWANLIAEAAVDGIVERMNRFKNQDS